MKKNSLESESLQDFIRFWCQSGDKLEVIKKEVDNYLILEVNNARNEMSYWHVDRIFAGTKSETFNLATDHRV